MKRQLRTLGSLVRRPPVVGALVLFAVWSAVMSLRVKGRLQYLELKVYDQLLVSQPRDTRAADQVVVVGIDEVDIRAMKRAIISDRNLAKLLDRLYDLGAAAVGVDLFRDQAEGSADANADDNAADRKRLLDTIVRTRAFCVELPGHDPADRVPAPRILYRRNHVVDRHTYHPYQQVTTCEMQWDGRLKDQEARRGLLFEPMSDALWTDALSKELTPAERQRYAADRPAEFSLSGAVVNHFLRYQGADRTAGSDWLWATPGFVETRTEPWWNATWLRRFTPDHAAYTGRSSEHDEGYQYLLDFRGPDVRPEFATGKGDGSIPAAGPGDSVRLAVRQLLDRSDKSELPGWDELKPDEKRVTPVTDARNPVYGRMVFIGTEAVSVKDYINCPRDAYYRGVEYHALQADQLLRLWKGWAKPLRFLSHRYEALYVLLWGLPGLVLGYQACSAARVAVYGTAGVVAFAIVTVVAFRLNWWLPSLPPAMVFAACALLMSAYASQHERAERQLVDNLFRRTAGAQVVSELWARRDDIFEHGRLLPRTCTATVLFIDFEGFSRRAEALATPERLIEWLERTLRAMTAVTLASGGTILRYMGDSFEAVFGAPVYRTTPQEIAADAAAAVACALALRAELGRLNAAGAARGEPPLRMRVGVNTGPVAVGTIGGGTRIEYAVLGDATNVASRMESCLKDRMGPDVVRDDCRILVSQATYDTARDAAGDRFEVFRIGPVQIHNHSDVVAYAVLGINAPAVHRGAPELATA